MKEFETSVEAMAELRRLAIEFFSLPTPLEYDSLSQEEQEKALEKITPLKEEIEGLTTYIKEKWRSEQE